MFVADIKTSSYSLPNLFYSSPTCVWVIYTVFISIDSKNKFEPFLRSKWNEKLLDFVKMTSAPMLTQKVW